MIRRMSAALVLSTALAGAAFAQQPATGDAQPTTRAPAMSAPAGDRFVTDQGVGDYRASKFVGLDIYGSDGEKIGDVTEILLDKSGEAKTVVIGVGGFLGIGQKNVAVPFASLEWLNTRPQPKQASGAGPTTTGSTTPAMPAGSTPTAPATPAVPTRSPDEQASYNGYPDHGVVKLSRADLQNAPAFKYYSETHGSSGASNTAPPTTNRP